jgi:hypothetical protein
VKLLRRLDINHPGEGRSVKVIYVDNCCSVRKKLLEIFGSHVHLKLDPFHWLQRWNDALCEPSSGVSGIFRGMMSRALFTVTSDEYD